MVMFHVAGAVERALPACWLESFVSVLVQMGLVRLFLCPYMVMFRVAVAAERALSACCVWQVVWPDWC